MKLSKKGVAEMARKGENIRKRKDGRWEGRYKKGRKPNGKIDYGSVYGKTYAEVKEKLQIMKALYNRNDVVVTKDMMFGDILSLWLANNRIKNKGATETKYLNLIETHILPELGGLKMSQLTAPRINAFLLAKIEKGRIDKKGGLSESYVSSMMLIIDSSIKFAASEKICDPLRSKIYKPVIPKTNAFALPLNKQHTLESYIKMNMDFTKLGVLISLHTGMRIGEVCALSWDDIDLKAKLVHVRHTVSRIRNEEPNSTKYKLVIETPKTTSSVRDIPLTPYLVSALIILKSGTVSPYVISSDSTFVNPRTYEYRYKKILKDCNMQQFNYHVLRHTFATRCIEAGMDIKSLSELLGHADIAFTMKKYVHPSLDLKRMHIEKMTQLAS